MVQRSKEGLVPSWCTAGGLATLQCLLKACSFSDGSLSWKDSVSITMLKNDREVLGPSILLVAIGTPKCVQISIAVLRLLAHWRELGLPMNKKSSR